mmetsp:Transcript_65337/g.131416  ORF Transcript_65337/g.131416 Transcript_65337/m.131416 type:complete len:82 (+) Transcript_65337:792-1037(+)
MSPHQNSSAVYYYFVRVSRHGYSGVAPRNHPHRKINALPSRKEQLPLKSERTQAANSLNLGPGSCISGNAIIIWEQNCFGV